MKRTCRRALACCLAFGAFNLPSWADDAAIQLTLPRLFDLAVTRHLRMLENGAGVELESGELFEDDGPAAGRSYRKPENREKLSAQTWIKKELHIPNPEARGAWLVVLSEGPLDAVINGIPQRFGANESGRSAYQTLRFDPKVLRPGRNDIILRNSGNVMIARDDEFALGSLTLRKHPNRSAKSIDAGQTWDYEHLGPDGSIDGEYGVRIFLDHHRSQGSLTTPVIDLGDPNQRGLGLPLDRIGPISVAVHGDFDAASKIGLRVRTGTSYQPTGKAWSDWHPFDGTDGTIRQPAGRYLQVEVNIATVEPLKSPRMKGLTVRSNLSPTSTWTEHVTISEAHNDPILRTAIPFEFEPLDHPRLKKLREDYHLDDVVNGAQGELDLMLRLAQWACNAWDWPSHIFDRYPAWDALDILQAFGDGKPTGGFCQQFNLVFLQACESFGIPGRAISISQGAQQQQYPAGGHEIVELWSNEWKKWVYVDGALAWYVVDDQSGTPLSMLELRERQIAWLRGDAVAPVRAVKAPRTRNQQFPWKGIAGPDPSNWYLELRLIPRSNFLQASAPLPLNQGTEEWAWTGHYVWTDTAVPAGLLFGNRVSKRSDFAWSLNQAHIHLEAQTEPGQFTVHLDTETPSFRTFLARIDDQEPKPVHSGFAWTLRSGLNRLKVWPQNILGRDGIPSSIALEFSGGRRR